MRVSHSRPRFNPRAREGRDLGVEVRDLYREEVSIHAPVKGATQHDAVGGEDSVVSIHAPVKGATDGNPKVHVCYVVSIHAPVKGATPFWNVFFDVLLFQSTRP